MNATPIDFNDENSNTSSNTHFDQLLSTRLSRRQALTGAGAVAAGSAGLLGSPLAQAATGTTGKKQLLGFKAVAKNRLDAVTLPEGYQYQVIYALGDPLYKGVDAYKNDGSDTDFHLRAGDHHDGMEWFGLSATGQASAQASNRGLLAMNHEATTDEKLTSFFIHTDGGTSQLPRPAAEVNKEMAIHGVSIVEVRKQGGKWQTQQDSPFNHRITPLTEIAIEGPAKGSPFMVTRFSPTGVKTRGTMNNCGTGKTPWGTFLTGEENWVGYFYRNAGDDAKRSAKSVVTAKRYGRTQAAPSRHGWETAGSDDAYLRWNVSQTGSSADGSDDYRNEMNGQGYIVELDAYNKTQAARKRTALGRFAHESAAFGRVVAGQPVVAYMGDDARNEYMYKFVSQAMWNPADAKAKDKLAVGDKYLNEGTLYVAKFSEDGTGQWIALTMDNPAIAQYAAYKFESLADIVVNARLAADAVGATKMDRPEWCAVNPKNGELYQTLTNNSNRTLDPKSGAQLLPDSANPRAYTDIKGAAKAQSGNPNGHLLRLKEAGDMASALRFQWDIYLFGAQSDADPQSVNLSSLTSDQDFSSPDGLVFSPVTGICWIQTDDGAYTDVSNCMMMAALPGSVGDGARRTLSYQRADKSKLDVSTPVGKAPSPLQLKRFLVGAIDCEITGLCETPDGGAIFVNIQHPGEGTSQSDIGNPERYTSQWPSNMGYGKGKRPRSATVVITRKDGGVIGT